MSGLWQRAKARVRTVIHPKTYSIGETAGKTVNHPGSRRDWKVPDQETGEFHILRAMDGPFYRCEYLGYTPISKPPTGINALQSHLKDLYLKCRRPGSGGKDSSLKLIQQGIFITLLQDGQIVDELFFSFDTVNFIEAVKFSIVRNSDKKPKAIFVPVDEGPTNDKHAFTLDKPFHFLTSCSHPPLVACVVRRPKGVKALDCHLFALESVENALHITSLVGSAQTTPAGYDARVGQGFGGFDSRGSGIEVDPRGDGNFNRGVRGGDVIRPDYSDYSFYRGGHNYEPMQNMGHPPNDMVGGGRLPPTNIQRMPPGGPFHHGGYPVEDGMVYGLYEQPRSGALIAGPMPRRAGNMDNNPMMYNRRVVDNNSITPGNRSLSTGSEHSAVGLRPEDARHLNRHSTGIYADPNPSPRYPSNNHFPPTSNQSSSRSSTPITSQVSPRRDNADFGPVFSASNLENREQVMPQKEEPTPDQYTGGKPIAKVPPHLRGVKVLPSDFRKVKLKPMTEKRSGSVDSQDSNYDNNNDIMQKYKALQELEGSTEGNRIPANGNVKMDGKKQGKESADPVLRHDRNKQESARHHRFSAPVYADSAPINHWTSGGGHHPSQSAYNMGVADDPGNTKDAEIASMFSNMGIHNGNARRQQHVGFDFEDTLGYLP